MISLLLVLLSQQPIQDYRLDIFHHGNWVGDSSTRIEETEWRGQKVVKSQRTTRLSRASGRIKPSFSEVVQYQKLDGDLIHLRYTFSTGIEAQELEVDWGAEKIRVTRRGFGGQGVYEPATEEIARGKAATIGGSPLDSLLLGGAGKRSTVNLSLNLQSAKFEESQMLYKGEATVQLENVRREALEYHIVRGKAVLYKVFLDDRTNLPLRVESLDGLLMVPAKSR